MKDKLEETKVDRSKKLLFRKQKKSSSPSEMFANTAWASRLWFIVSMVLLGYIAVQPYLVIEAYRNKERVVIMDGAGTYSISPLLTFEESKDLHENIALLATMSLFSQNPGGFDYSDMLERIFYKEARVKAEEYQKGIESELSSKNIHQKQQVFKIKILKTRNDVIIAKVKGELIRNGNLEGKEFIENIPFLLDLTLVRNPDMLSNKRYPLAVYDFSIGS